MCKSLDHVSIFSELHTTLGFPINKRSVGPRKVPLSENVIGEMSNFLQFDVLVQADSLDSDSSSWGMDIAVREP